MPLIREGLRETGLDLVTAAKYPFLKESAEYVKGTGVTLEALVSGIAYERARMRGKERVMEVLHEGAIEDHPLTTEADAVVELLSYPVARMIVSAVADPMFVRRYAIAEAKKANERLRNEDTAFVLRVAEELGLDVAIEQSRFSIDFVDFLRFSAKMRSRSWKLVNQELVRGRVMLTKPRLVRMIEAVLTERFSSELPLEVNDTILERFSKEIEEIKANLEERRREQQAEGMGRFSIVRFPPCMRKLLEMIRAGENVPHSGRFALVAFLHTLGMDSEEILETFSTAPDFDERKSRYQVEHISGEISGTEYTPPECSTMRSYGICFDPDDLCRRIKHPLSYYRAKGKAFRSLK